MVGRLVFALVAGIAANAASAQQPTMEQVFAAAIRLKASKVENTYNDCIKMGGRDESCRSLIQKTHETEREVSISFMNYIVNPKIDRQQFMKEFNRCVGRRDYIDSVMCQKDLAERIADALEGRLLVTR